MSRILVADDDPQIREVVVYALENAGFQPVEARDGDAALEAAKDPSLQLAILDVGMPGEDGFAVCREIRKTSNLPILFLTARDDEIDRVVGFEIGGDDYVTKPFSPREVVARVKAILKRNGRATDPTGPLQVGNLMVDTARHICQFDGQSVPLTASEFALLERLMAHPDIVLSRPQLTDALYGANIHVSERTIDSHVRNLRRKLAEAGAPEAIETVHGVGLRMGSCARR